MYQPKYHHKAKAWMAFAAIAALVTAGCAKGDESDGGGSPSGGRDSVEFGAYVSGVAESRASVADIAALKQTSFGVFASRTGNDDFNPDATGGHTPDFMYNQKVEWRAAGSGADALRNGTWFYEPVKGWPGSKVSFFAYAPYAAVFGKTGITGITGPDVQGSPKLTFRMDGDIDGQTDLLYADSGNTTDLLRGGQVQFRFRHAMSRVGFRCAADRILDANTTVTVNSVRFGSSALGVSGDLDLCTGKWESLATAEAEYTLGTDDFIDGANVITGADGTAVSDLTADGKYLMIIPSNGTVPVTITVNYDVVTADDNLAAGNIGIENEITTTFDFNFETGKAYGFILRLGMRSVEIDAGVSDWSDSETDWTPVGKR